MAPTTYEESSFSGTEDEYMEVNDLEYCPFCAYNPKCSTCGGAGCIDRFERALLDSQRYEDEVLWNISLAEVEAADDAFDQRNREQLRDERGV